MKSINSYAANTFTKGLIMDFDPTVTKNDSLVNALNATLLTFNGNEMQLQQDMGNGRVETAFLPEGYIPVGCCEFGGIIYVVSYNPLEDKSQVGCFPSPERNITSDEVSNIETTLSYTDFQEVNDGKITGQLKTTGVRKILYEKSNLNPGDKYVIYTEDASDKFNENNKTLTDFGNTEPLHNYWPKLLKINIVSIEDSGKIINLNSSVKWYDNDYYITNLIKNTSSGKKDLDSYRSLVSSPYSIFSSKVSGKLAILVEPEMIDSFNCTYEVYTERITKQNGLEEDKYDSSVNPDGSREDSLSTSSTSENVSNRNKYVVYFNTSWTSSHPDINPYGFLITESEWKLKETDNGKNYISEVPLKNNTGTYVEYKPDTANEDFLKFNVRAKTVISNDKIDYDPEKLYTYRTIYNLAKPSDTYDKYKTEDSYLAQINDKIDWYKTKNKDTNIENYDGLENQEDYSKVGPVTKITRIKDGNNFKYYYNLVSIDSKNKKYQTKGSDGSQINIKPIDLEHDIINNYFKKEVTTKLNDTLELPISEVINGHKYDCNNSRAIWSYTVAPAMPYGVLDHLSISGNIDFSKINSGFINMSSWRYFTEGDVLTLTFGLEAYPEPNKGIVAVDIDFFDNEGFAAGYHLADKNSYSGQFTEKIILRGNNYTINSIDSRGENHNTRKNAGIIYPNMLYLCKITIKYVKRNALGEYDSQDTSEYKTMYRWLWTNGIFNNNYYTTLDFNNLAPELELGLSEFFDISGSGTTNKLNEHYAVYKSTDLLQENSEQYKSLAANVMYINQGRDDDANGNILLKLTPYFKNNYNTFKLNSDLTSLGDIDLEIANPTISFNVPKLKPVFETYDTKTSLADAIIPIINKNLSDTENNYYYAGYCDKYLTSNNKYLGKKLFALLALEQKESHDDDIYDSITAYQNYKDSFSLNFTNSGTKRTVSIDDAYNNGIPLTLSGYVFNKMGATELTTLNDINFLTPIISYVSGNKYSLENLNLHCGNLNGMDNHFYYSTPLEDGKFLGHREKYTKIDLTEQHLFFDNAYALYFDYVGNQIFAGYSNTITDGGWNAQSVQYNDSSTEHDGSGTVYDLKNIDSTQVKITDSKLTQLFRVENNANSCNTAALILANHNLIEYGSFPIYIDGPSSHKLFNSFYGGSWHNIPNQDNIISDHLYGTTFNFSYWLEPDADNRRYPVYTFIVYDSELHSYVPLSDYFIGGYKYQWNHDFDLINKDSGSHGKTSYNFDYCSNYFRNPKIKALTLADMLGSLFTQIYTTTNLNKKYYKFDNIVQVSDYIEYWNSDISCKFTSLDLTNFVLFHTMSYPKYISAIIKKCFNENIKLNDYSLGEKNIFKAKNAKITLNNVLLQEVANTKTIKFRYEIPYNVSDLLREYSSLKDGLTIVNTCYCDSNKNRIIKYIGQKTEANKFYTLENDFLTELGNASIIYYAKYFITNKEQNKNDIFIQTMRDELPDPEYDTDNYIHVAHLEKTQMNSLGFNDLAKIIRMNNGVLEWHGLTKLNDQKYDIVYRPLRPDPITKKEYKLIDFPNISLFNEYNPGAR